MIEGDGLPPAALTLADGSAIDLASLAGQPLVVFFFPRADTPGCTDEARDFSALASDFDAAGARVVGVSRDTPAKLARFADKHQLGVLLASDGDGSVTQGWGVWVEKSMYGRTSMGIERATFLFGADGRLARQWRKVKVRGHAEEVLAAVRAL